MSTPEAVTNTQFLLNAIILAQSRGAYKLEESHQIFETLKKMGAVSEKPPPAAEPPTPEVAKEEKSD